MKNPCTSPAVVHSIEPLESRIAPAFATVLDLATLTGPNGFQFSLGGQADNVLISTHDAGDINADGFADIIANAEYVTSGGVDTVESYVVFGKSGGFPAEVDLLNLESGEGFKIGNAAAGDLVTKVSEAGDINDDGFDDLVVSGSGIEIDTADYLLFGHSGAFPAVVPLSSLAGSTGLKINNGRGGVAAGDINGDGVDDLLINAPYIGAAGASYIVFGKAGNFFGKIDIFNLNGTDGFKINGEGGSFARAGTGAGDVNGDGFDDLIIGAPFAGGNASGISYVIFGHGGAFPATIQASGLDGTNGFKLRGQIEDRNSGISVSGAGDINHDGFDDVVVGSIEGDVYVVFGHSGTFPSSISLQTLTATTGFVIDTGPRDEHGPLAVSDAGDVNGDGFDDLVIGDRKALIFNAYGDRLGVSYVVYGHGGAFADKLVLASLDGKEGFQINGDGSGSDVHGAGDVNGDGFDDVLIAGFQTSYVLFGPGFTPIAPKISDNGRTATFIDADGDRVKVKTSRGSFDASNFAINAAPGGVTGGGHFGGLDLSDLEFAGANLNITAKRGPLGGDGLVNLGFLDATGIDLGKVKIDGDLGRLEVGDANLETPALGALNVVSMGAFGVSTQFDIVQGFESHVVGSIPEVKIATDLREIHFFANNLGTVKVGGSIGVPFTDAARRTEISVDGSLTSLSVGGDIKFTVLVASGDIGKITAVGRSGKFKLHDGISVQGSIVRTQIHAGGDISRLAIGGDIQTSVVAAVGEPNPADLLAAQTIGEIIVNGRVERSIIVGGGNLQHTDVQIGKIVVGSDWIASSLSAGSVVSDGHGGVTINPGGDPAIIASVASIVIRGQVIGTVGGGDLFGFFAEKIVAFESGNVALQMTDGADNFNVGTTSDVTVRDLL